MSMNDPQCPLLQAVERYDNTELKRLIETVHFDTNKVDNAFRWAAYYGNTTAVKILLPMARPDMQNSQPLQWAVQNGYAEIVDLLFPLSNPLQALHELQLQYPHNTEIWVGLEQKIADQQKEKIATSLNLNTNNTKQSQRKI